MPNKRNAILRFSLAILACTGSWLAQPLFAASAQLLLTNGWNLISIPLAPTNASIQSVLAPIQGDYQSVWSYINQRWYGYNPSVPGLDDLKHIYAGKAYWIQMRRDAVLTINGLPSINAPDSFAGHKLTPGWNLLGYSSGLAESVTEAFAPIPDGSLDFAAAYSNGGWVCYLPGNLPASTLAILSPFHGLWVHVNTNTTWNAPNYRGNLVDSVSGKPVVGATVALDGIEAEIPTDAQGSFIIEGISDSASQLFTAAAPGYESLSATIDLSQAPTQPVSFFLDPLSGPLVADILTPQNFSVWLQADGCSQPEVTIRGYTALHNQSNFLYDIVFVIDTSASTARLTGYDLNGDGLEDTVFEAEVEACRRLATTLADTNHIRFGVVKFARNHTKNAPDGSISDGPLIPAETRLVQALTRDPALVQAALNTVAGEGAVGGTDIAAGIDLAIQTLTNALPAGANYLTTPVRQIVLVSDGIPTLPVESGSTQERGDRVATLQAAQRAVAANIAIHPVVLDSTNDIERKLTTMPSVQAITGVPGDVVRINLNDIQQLPDLLASLALTSIPVVSIVDETSGTNWTITVEPNGWFEALLPVALGTNLWEFSFASGDLTDEQTITRSVSFTIYPSNAVLDFASLTASNPPVSELTYLENPTGGKLYDGGPELSLLSVLTNTVPEARVLPGVESFQSISNDLTFEFIFKGSGYNSDVGYFVFDPSNPPKTAAEALAGLTQTNVFFNTGSMPSNTLSVTGFVNSVEVPPGTAVGIFMIPNGHLADAQSPPTAQCSSYPIALSMDSLAGVTPGTVLSNIWNGSQSGNFGWLSWSGDVGDPALVTSLTPPGNSSTYVNPDNPADHQLVAGKWVSGRPGVANSSSVRNALNALMSTVMVVPVWDQAYGQGNNAAYHICAFANVQIVSYQLSAQNMITARFLGFTDCGRSANAPLFTLAALNPGQFDQALTFYDPVGNQIVCAFEDIDILSKHSDQDFQDLVFTVKSTDPVPQRTECAGP